MSTTLLRSRSGCIRPCLLALYFTLRRSALFLSNLLLFFFLLLLFFLALLLCCRRCGDSLRLPHRCRFIHHSMQGASRCQSYKQGCHCPDVSRNLNLVALFHADLNTGHPVTLDSDLGTEALIRSHICRWGSPARFSSLIRSLKSRRKPECGFSPRWCRESSSEACCRRRDGSSGSVSTSEAESSGYATMTD